MEIVIGKTAFNPALDRGQITEALTASQGLCLLQPRV